VNPRHVYFHVPFCARKCSYCDFAIAVRRAVPVDDYLHALDAELKRRAPSRLPVDSVYLGGGTPSRLGAQGIARLMDLARNHFEITAETEITIEANPDDVDANQTKGWRESGINRVSLGIQSFDDSVLQWMHRVHNAAAAVRAFETLRENAFDNISIDLIFALPASLDRSWATDLERAIALGPDHISLYGLTIERSTPLARWRERGAIIPADEDAYAAEFLLADVTMRSAGFDHYEVSNFARPSKRSQHNSAYWSGVPYLGLGPSAHSYDGELRSWNAREYAEWLARLSAGESPVIEHEELTAENRLSEKVYLGLRTTGGLDVSGPDRISADRWTAEGWATIEGDRVRLTTEGWLRLDSLAAALTGI
jgi:oxygen-independent coproporphyrinogen-3 oxidase